MGAVRIPVLIHPLLCMDGRAPWLPPRALATYMLRPTLGIVPSSNSNSSRRRGRVRVYLRCSVDVGEPSRRGGLLFALDLLSSARVLGSLFHLLELCLWILRRRCPL